MRAAIILLPKTPENPDLVSTATGQPAVPSPMAKLPRALQPPQRMSQPPLLSVTATADLPDSTLLLSARRAAIVTLQLVGLQLGFGVVIGIGLAIWNLLMGLPSGTGTHHPLGLALGNLAAFGFILRREIRRGRTSLSALGTWRAEPVLLLVPLLLMVLGVSIVTSEMDNLLNAFLPEPLWMRQYFDTLFDLSVNPISALWCLAVVAPVTEEVLFRGLILRGLLATTTPVRAIALSSLLFAAMHLNPWQVPTVLAFGVFTGWMYLRTRSLLLCILAHALNNAFFILLPGLPFAIPGFNMGRNAGVVYFQPWWFDIGGLLLLAGGVALFHRLAFRLPLPARPAEPPLLVVSEAGKM